MPPGFDIVMFSNQFSQELGLRFRTPARNTLYIFDFKREVRNAFSMWFVFKPIDIFFLDKSKKVVDLKRDFQPFTSYRAKRRFRYAVETRPGLLTARPGDRIAF